MARVWGGLARETLTSSAPSVTTTKLCLYSDAELISMPLYLKYSLALSYFHSKKTEHIFQEIFARLTMYNFAELITSHVTVKQKSGEHPYKVNFAAAVHICREFFLKNISPSLVEGLLLQYLLPIRNRPASPRMMRTKQAPTFSYRIP